MQRGKTREDEGKCNSHIPVRLPKMLHSFGKAPVREFPSRVLAMVCGEKKARKAGVSSRVN